jgi:hypothetical protein
MSIFYSKNNSSVTAKELPDAADFEVERVHK